MAQMNLDDSIQPNKKDNNLTSFKFKKFHKYKARCKSNSAWISHKWCVSNRTIDESQQHNADTNESATTHTTKVNSEGKENNLHDEIECESDHSKLDLTDDDRDDEDDDDDDSMNGTSTQDDESKDDESNHDEGLLENHIQVDKEYICEDGDNCRWYSHGDSVPFAEGKFRYVYHSNYCTNAQRDDLKQIGQKAVVKKWKDDHIFNEYFWAYDQRVCEIAQKLIDKWNCYEKIKLKKSYKILKPKVVWRANHPNDNRIKKEIALNECILIEDYLPGEFLKWNSNSGWTSKEQSSMQAFCHWTYHYSDGKILFCDAQGIITKNEYILTDPCILSVEGDHYGAADCGFDYILNWFKHHRCNKYCQKHWIKPQGEIEQTIDVTRHTTWTWSTEKFKKKKEQEKKELCKCGKLLVCKPAKDIKYVKQDTQSSSHISCDECDAKVDGLTVVFTCPVGRNHKHPKGYNLCYQCFVSKK